MTKKIRNIVFVCLLLLPFFLTAVFGILYMRKDLSSSSGTYTSSSHTITITFTYSSTDMIDYFYLIPNDNYPDSVTYNFTGSTIDNETLSSAFVTAYTPYVDFDEPDTFSFAFYAPDFTDWFDYVSISDTYTPSTYTLGSSGFEITSIIDKFRFAPVANAFDSILTSLNGSSSSGAYVSTVVNYLSYVVLVCMFMLFADLLTFLCTLFNWEDSDIWYKKH